MNFFVAGIPQTKGSVRAFTRPGGKFPILTNDNPKNKAWAARVTAEAQAQMSQAGMDPPEGIVKLMLRFHVSRPKRVGACATPSTTRPDIDKLARSVLDALEGVCYRNDAQVCALYVEKYYADPIGVYVWINWGEEGTKRATKKKKAVKKLVTTRTKPSAVGTLEPGSS